MVVIHGEGHQINGAGVDGFDKKISVFSHWREPDMDNH